MIKPLADEDGNDILPVDPASPIGQLIYLLEWGRKRGFRIGPTVQIGDTIVQVRDLREQVQGERAPEGSIWEEHGHSEQ